MRKRIFLVLELLMFFTFLSIVGFTAKPNDSIQSLDPTPEILTPATHVLINEVCYDEYRVSGQENQPLFHGKISKTP
ncbi:MAG: hypothetical protein ACE5OZ_19985 [Candidatus Heimdallarchaeota archaeon]